jgi:hypothetical protein
MISFFANFIDDRSSINRPKPKEPNPMKTDESTEAVTVFLQNLPGAVSKLKNRLQRDYEQAYPGLGDLVRIILDEEEAKAWELSFPHLFLPDLMEAHIAQLGLRPAEIRHNDVVVPHRSFEMPAYQPALAL